MTGKNFSKLRFCNPGHVISELKFNFDLDIVSVFVCIVNYETNAKGENFRQKCTVISNVNTL